MEGFDAGRWNELSPLLDELLDLDPEARTARLEALRGTDPALAAEAQALLARQTAVARAAFLEGGPDALSEEALAGRAFGNYRLDRLVGRGGMGAVWLAHRSDGRFEAAVAVKLLDLALVTRGGVERFRREGNLLARLTHPGITHLLDAGVAEGQPYLVLEYVEGRPIDAFCDERRLPVHARVRLVLEVLAAVAHAHDHLVLHRDLKPSNILVTVEGKPKLLDFGIAKLLGEEELAGGAPTELTHQAGRAFTPEYAAPEQVQGGNVTLATDVYALGVLLHRLLAGSHPTAGEARTPVERVRAIVEAEPARLSAAATLASPDVAALRGATPAQLSRALSGDLDNIVGKALKKSPADRYATVHALADDLRRYLSDEPVAARPDTLGYRLGKAVRRHRLAFGAAAAVLLVLLAGVAGTTWQALEAGRQRAGAVEQRDRAQRLLARSEAVAGFIEMMLTEGAAPGQAEALQGMLDKASGQVGAAFAEQPEFQAEVLRVLGTYYVALELPQKAAPLLERADELARQGADPSLRARIGCARALTRVGAGLPVDAGHVVDSWIDAPGVSEADAAYCLSARAALAETDADAPAVLGYADRGLAKLRAAPYPQRMLEAGLLGDRGFALHLLGRDGEAEAAYRASIEGFRTLGREESEEATKVMNDWATALADVGELRRAVELYQRLVTIKAREGGAMAPLVALANCAFALERLGRYDEALAYYGQALSAAERVGMTGGESYALIGRASVLEAQGRVDEAEEAMRRATAAEGSMPEAHPVRLRQLAVQARIDARRGRLGAAQGEVTRVIELLSARGVRHPALVAAYRTRAEVSLSQGDGAAALADAQKAVELARGLQGSSAASSHTGLASLTLGKVLLAGGDHERARQALEAAVRQLQATEGEEGPDAREARRQLDEL